MLALGIILLVGGIFTLGLYTGCTIRDRQAGKL